MTESRDLLAKAVKRYRKAIEDALAQSDAKSMHTILEEAL